MCDTPRNVLKDDYGGAPLPRGAALRNALISSAQPRGSSQNGLCPRPSKIFTCACGNASPSIRDDVYRYSDLEGDDKIGCAGTVDAYVRGMA